MRRSGGSKARGVAGRCGLTGPCEDPVGEEVRVVT